MPIRNKPVFACAPSAYGFKSLFDSIFDPQDYHKSYILKGSCGSGKSSIIRRIALECDNRGMEYELFGCSFDPNSYDGIIICQPRICITDGTNPHAIEPLYLGAVEEVINTSEGLDCEKLPLERDKIIQLCHSSSRNFSKSFSLLRACLEVQNNLTDIITEKFQFDKMFSSIKRFMDNNFTQGTGFVKHLRVTNVFCKEGYYKGGEFFRRAGKKCLVLDKFGVAHLLLERIAKSASEYDQPVFVSVSSLDFERVDGLYFPLLDMAFEISTECTDRDHYYKVFNMARFVDKTALKQSKYKIRFLNKCFKELSQQACMYLGQAYNDHLELEKIYSRHTDYTYNDKIFSGLRDKVFTA